MINLVYCPAIRCGNSEWTSKPVLGLIQSYWFSVHVFIRWTDYYLTHGINWLGFCMTYEARVLQNKCLICVLYVLDNDTYMTFVDTCRIHWSLVGFTKPKNLCVIAMFDFKNSYRSNIGTVSTFKKSKKYYVEHYEVICYLRSQKILLT